MAHNGLQCDRADYLVDHRNAAQAINCQTGMSIELSEDERKLIIQALEHYDAYLHATSRRDGHAKELAERLQDQKPKHRTLAERPESPGKRA